MADRKQADEWEPNTWDELFPGRFLKHSHLGTGEVELLIERVFNTEIDGKLAQVARFAPVRGIEQVEWGLNKTNGICLRAMFGDAVKRDWPGKRVMVKASKVEHGRELGKPCIRVCGSPDIAADLAVVVDFKTKRIKPFTIRVRKVGGSGSVAPKASEHAVRLAKDVRAASTVDALTPLALDVEMCLENNTITRDEAKSLMDGINRRAKDLAESSRANV